jgi:hypothetical protein
MFHIMGTPFGTRELVARGAASHSEFVNHPVANGDLDGRLMHQLFMEEALVGGGNLHRSSPANNACLGAFGGGQTFTVPICDAAALPPLHPFVHAALSGGHTLTTPIHDVTAFPLLHPLVHEALGGCNTSAMPTDDVSVIPLMHPRVREMIVPINHVSVLPLMHP